MIFCHAIRGLLSYRILYFLNLHLLIYLVFSEALNQIMLLGHRREDSLHLQRQLLQHQHRAAPRHVVAGVGHDPHHQALGLGDHLLYFSMFYNIILCFSASIIKCTFTSTKLFSTILKHLIATTTTLLSNNLTEIPA